MKKEHPYIETAEKLVEGINRLFGRKPGERSPSSDQMYDYLMHAKSAISSLIHMHRNDERLAAALAREKALREAILKWQTWFEARRAAPKNGWDGDYHGTEQDLVDALATNPPPDIIVMSRKRAEALEEAAKILNMISPANRKAVLSDSSLPLSERRHSVLDALREADG